MSSADVHDATRLAASPRLFRNAFLDRLSRVHPVLPFLIYGPAAALLLLVAERNISMPYMIVAVAFGYVLWTLLEYFGHRFVFHIRPKSRPGKRLQFLIHGVHHEHPNDALRLVMPPLMSLPIMAAASGIARFAAGPRIALPVIAGFIGGYLIYDGVHFYVHHRRPENFVGRYLRRRHMHHHFRDDRSWFGVSAPWWDAVFATRPARERITAE